MRVFQVANQKCDRTHLDIWDLRSKMDPLIIVWTEDIRWDSRLKVGAELFMIRAALCANSACSLGI